MSKYHDILGVSPDDDHDAIKRAYRKKAAQCHPDKEGGDPEAFKQLQIAYDIVTGKKQEPEEFDAAEQLLIQLFQNAAEQTGDIVKIVTLQLRFQLKSVTDDTKKASNQLEKLRKRLKRVKTDSGVNLYEIALQGKIDGLSTNVQVGEEQQRILTRALEVLQKYKDTDPDEDLPPPVTGGRFWTTPSGAAW